MASDRPIPPRLIRVTLVTEAHTCDYHADSKGWDACSEQSPCRRARRRLAFVKCPYGGIHDMYALGAALVRAVNTRQIRWFRLDTRFEITPEVRAALKRWPDALAAAAPEVDWT